MSEIRLGVHPDEDYEKSITDETIELPVGSECTFGGCFVDFNPTLAVDQWYQIYSIASVNCTISKY